MNNTTKIKLVISSIRDIQVNLRELAIDMGALYPKSNCDKMLRDSADILSQWIDGIENSTIGN